jgi:uncharacterized protein
MRKSQRALRSARLGLRDGDADGAINRSCYAMLNAAQAALLSTGVPEDKLPKSHAGLISAFGQSIVKTGKVDPEFGRSISGRPPAPKITATPLIPGAMQM